ncbi:hypothetical protein CTAYLR_003078 [Chrysophaeum taylorii]|uniref:Uncharacterized protein n=1 Tax=Chrysophaeum taylorii TaxID=2483200 RepID=A0AAD7U7H7_9STRA|nr:hypothetical protein CTAYLR_003078 [Chrysophaeum taylorii]
MALVSGGDDVGVSACVVAAAVAGRRLGISTRVGRAFGGPVSAMALSFAASSTNLLPTDAPIVPAVRDLAVKFATPCLLLDADLGEICETSGPLLRVFVVAAALTTLASLAAWRLAAPSLRATLGSDAPGIAAALLAKNVGGGVNFIAVAKTCGVSPEAAATALAVDNVMALVYFPAVAAIAGSDYARGTGGARAVSDPTPPGALLEAVFAVLVVLVLAERLAPNAQLPAGTLLAVLGATVAPRKLRDSVAPAAANVADALLYVFFSAAGCAGGSIAACARAAGPPLFLFLGAAHARHRL